MAQVPKGQSCKNCARRKECETRKVAVWCVWYKPDTGKNEEIYDLAAGVKIKINIR